MEREIRSNGGDYHRIDRSSKSPLPISSSSSAARGVGAGVGGVSYIKHTVSKLDTLAGVAIKYGVEVADIKRINGLVTDLQMFARKTLHIPLPGRHPPSPILSNGFDTQGPSSSEQTPPNRRHSDLFDSFQSIKLKSSSERKVSPAMSCLRGYYGIKPTDQRTTFSEGFEMAVYRKGGSRYLEDVPLYNPPLSLHRKSKSLANGFMLENGDVGDDASVTDARENDSDRRMENLARRRQKSEADFGSRTPETLMKEDNNNGGGFSAITGKGLALRPNAANRTVAGSDAAETGWPNNISICLGDSSVSDGLNGVRKSSSTSNLQDSESNTSSSSIWSTSKWSLKPDLTRPIFDGLPKPISGRKNKAALD